MAASLENKMCTLAVLMRRLCVQKVGIGRIESSSTATRTISSVCHNTSFNKPLENLPASENEGRNCDTKNVVCLRSLHGPCCSQRRFASSKSKGLLTHQSPGPFFPKRPLQFEYAGDLMTQPPLNLDDLQKKYQDLPEFEKLSETLKKLCTLDHASGSEKKMHRQALMRERILHLFGRDADRELIVARLTVDIRNMIPHLFSMNGKDKLSKSRLVEKIQARKKLLKQLRKKDYQRFLWLLQELKIRYVMPPMYYKRVTRKAKRKDEVWQAANDLRLKKIAALKAQLEEEREAFMQHKEQTLAQIRADAEKYGLDLGAMEKDLVRERIKKKTYPVVLSWEEKQKLQGEQPQ